MKKVDLLIIGQGIAGTVLAFLAIQKGKSVAIIDIPMAGMSSRVAGGMFNPVTGRRFKKSWNYDVLYPKMVETYSFIDNILSIKSLHLMPIYRLLSGVSDVNNWELQRGEEQYKNFMDGVVHNLDNRIVHHYGAGLLQNGGWLDVELFLDASRLHLKNTQILIEEAFDIELLAVNQYKDIYFENVVFCEGYRLKDNLLFPETGLSSTKGETMVIKMEGEDLDYIINKNMLLIPLGKGRYKVGATLERNLDFHPTALGLQELKEKVESVVSIPFEVLQHDAGIRPNVRDRKPLLGVSEKQSNAYVFNGLGSKGVSLAPYFAEQLLLNIYEGIPLAKDVDWKRMLKK